MAMKPRGGLRRRWALMPALALLAGVGVAAFFLLFEPVERTVRTGWSQAARRDPLLAARRFLTAMGVPAESSEEVEPLPPPGGLLVLMAERPMLSRERAMEVLAWVEQGGYLLASPDPILLSLLGVVQLEEPKEDRTWPPAITAQRVEARPGESYEVGISVPDRLLEEPEEPEPGTGDPEYFESGPGGENGHLLIRKAHGSGWVAVLADPTLPSNARLGDLEHAAFFWSAVTVAGKPESARLVRWLEYPSLGFLLWRHGWRAVVAGAVLLGFWLWRRAARFGPLLPDPSRERRSLIEHIRASAEFLWRRGEAASLVESGRQALLKRAGVRFPGFARMPSRAKVEKLAALGELPGETVSWALGGTVPGRPHELTRMIETLERLRRPL